MAIDVIFRSACHSTTNDTSYVTNTGAFTPAAGSLMLAFWGAKGGTQVPSTITGNSLTYTQGSGVDWGTGRIEVWHGIMGGSPTSGEVSIGTWSTNRTACHMVVVEVTGADTSGGSGAALVQTVTNSSGTGTGSLTFAAAGDSNNRPIAFYGHDANEDIVHETNWTELNDGGVGSPNSAGAAQWRSDTFDTGSTATWTTTSANWAAVGVEIKVSSGTPVSFVFNIPAFHLFR